MADATAEAVRSRRPGWFRRHKVFTVFALLIVLLLALVGGWSVYLNSQLQQIPRIDAGIKPSDGDGTGSSGSGSGGSSGRGVNILIGGTDTRHPGEMVRLLRAGWQPGAMRSDTIMIVHVCADRRHAYVVSIPRDTWTDVPGYGDNKINAAFSFGGPRLYVKTVQDFTGLTIDHLVLIDWTGFRQLTEALGGVDVTVPRTVIDPEGSGQVWHQGTVHLEGQLALDYVHQRYGLPNGDFDRINRQQNLVRAIAAKLLSEGTASNPVRLTSTVQAITSHLVLDDTFTNSRVRSLALSLRNVRMKDVTFVTVPLKRYAHIRGQAVNLVDRRQTRGLFGAVLTDDLDTYLAHHDIKELPSAGRVS